MQELQAAFLADAPRRIQNLRENLNRLRAARPDEQPELVRKLFRQLHTLKGSAAAFDFAAVSRIAHELESFLEIINAENFAESIAVLEDGFDEIENAFAEIGENSASPEIGRKLDAWRAVRDSARQNKVENAEPIALPFDLEKQLNSTEIERVRQALKSSPTLAVIAVKFTAAGFAADFCQTQAKLNERGEIVATLPDAAKTNGAEIGLRLILASRERAEKIGEILTDLDAEIVGVFENKLHPVQKPARSQGEQSLKEENHTYFARVSASPATAKLSDLWAQASLAGQKTAAAQSKKVDFQLCENAAVEIAGERAEACEIAFLHIARNAVAHGIETPAERHASGKNESGAVRLEIRRENDALSLQISDDGRGIDAEKVRQLAKERKLIPENLNFDDQKAAQIIFLPGFSTAAAVTEDAGRGVGLDAVDAAVRAAGGSIEVSSRIGRGTTFLIRFPDAEKHSQS